ncbi:MAG TPA: response regulator [Candidatus Binatia bacterium]|nr:response regulator [Candidatus Binatia bacterium]
MDLRLPEMNGAETTTCLKANPSTRDIPVLIITAYGTGIDTRRALKAGASAILQKPIDLTTFAQCSAPIFISENHKEALGTEEISEQQSQFESRELPGQSAKETQS